MVATESKLKSDLEEILKSIKINKNKSESEGGTNVNTIVSQKIEVSIIKAKEAYLHSEQIYTQKEENLQRIINFLSVYDFKLQNLMSIINLFDVMTTSKKKTLKLSNDSSSNSKDSSRQNSSQTLPKLNFSINPNLIKIHLKIKKIQEWSDISNIKAIIQFIINFQWKVNYLAHQLFINYLQTNLDKQSISSNLSMASSLYGKIGRRDSNINPSLQVYPRHSSDFVPNIVPDAFFKNFQLFQIFDNKFRTDYEKYIIKFKDDLDIQKSALLQKEAGIKQKISKDLEKIS